ncbi:MAG: DNA gyrase subunit A, partial [Pseudomonadota bacterium]
HNAGELMAALIALAQKPGLDDDALLEHVLAPDFPTGGLIVHEEEALRKIYLEGRGSLRLRSKWHLENLSGGAWILVVEEIPFGIQKARLVERLALMVQSRKAPFLDEVRDESAHDVRLVLVPKSRNSDPDQIMETLFRTSELEIRFSVNMNVLLDQGRVPRQASLRTMLQAFIDHRYDVMHRQSAFRIDRLERRIELLKGYLIAYQNLDAIIHIIREEDKPKPILMERFSLSDAQAEAILNMRLRALRKLEEQIITKEHDQLVRELDRLRKLVESPALQRRQLIREFKALQTRFAKNPTLFERRSTLIPMPETEGFDPDALTPREPVTVICSKGGWMRCIKAHIADPAELKYREGDAAGLMVHALSSERILIAFASGRFYTLAADKLPGGRGAGEPLNLLLELAQHDQPIALLAYRPDCRLLLASSAGHGFVIQSNQLLTQTRLGKQIMNPVEGARLVACIEVQGDQVATVASNRRMLVLNLDEIPQLARGRGVMLQRLKGGAELKDLCSFDAQEGLRWQSGTRMRHETRWRDWQAKRATPGRPLPHGFPAGLRFQR